MNLKIILAPVLLLLCGCPAGIAPIAGYHVTDTKNEPRLVCSSNGPAIPGTIQLYETRIDHRYRLWVTPDGGREAYPLKESYFYSLAEASGGRQALNFFTSPDSHRFKWIAALSGDRFVACALQKGEIEPALRDTRWDGPLPPSSGYEIVVFDRKRILHRCKVQTAYAASGFRVEGEFVRFQGPDGPRSYDPKENTVQDGR